MTDMLSIVINGLLDPISSCQALVLDSSCIEVNDLSRKQWFHYAAHWVQFRTVVTGHFFRARVENEV